MACGETTESRRSPRRRLGTAIPGWCGSSIPCVGAWLRKPSRIPSTSPSRNLKTPCKIGFSFVPRTWTAFTNKPDQEMLSTSMENSLRAVATIAIALHLTTQISTIRPPKSPGANAAVGFARTSAGSARCRSNWIESIAHWINPRSSWQWEHQAWSSPLPALLLKSLVGHRRSTW
jgi:hypothetical protein